MPTQEQYDGSERLMNAATIYRVGIQMGMSTRDIQTAIITAMVESNLLNVHYGDRDSLGLFQQRPSQGWGTPAQVLDPVYAAKKFYSALRGLSNRNSMSMGAAAQAVQRSAYPGRYAERIGEMRKMWPSIIKAGGGTPLNMDGQEIPTDNPPSLIPNQNTVIPWNGKEYEPTDIVGTPDASTMLGAWTMDSPQPTDAINLDDGTSTILSPSTFTNYIVPLMNGSQASASGEMPGFGKGVDGWRRAVIQAAESALGTPYTWGGNSLQNGVDCSGLVQQAFAKAGISLPRVSYQQANYGQRVGYAGLQPGDLVAWNNSSRNNGADHIAIYLGNGKIIEAPRPGLSVRIRSIGKGLDGGWGVHLSG